MRVGPLNLAVKRQATPLPMWHAEVDAEQWCSLAAEMAAADGRLVSLWGSDAAAPTGGAHVSAAYATPDGLLWVDLALGTSTTYPDVAGHFSCAARMQRATADLLGLRAEGAADHRPWLDHGVWREAQPLRRSREGLAAREPAMHSDYEFVTVEGDGVHEIPVGPVHAGIIEPGHFRFSIVGEKVLRLEERLGYAHKGIERRFTELSPLAAHRLAGRVSGDSTVAFAWAYCMALESALGIAIPARAQWLRADARARTRGQSPGRPGRHRQRRRAGVWAGAVLAPARRLAARINANLRAPVDDGRRRAGRDRVRGRQRGDRAHACAVRAREIASVHVANDL
jgi:Ni,Fe-hydrogenase III component G